jgi:ATP/maltotriose-dependent transcriptional regulator MalT
MTTKDYEIVADAIREQREVAIDAFEIGTVEAVVERLSAAFLADNPRFHKATFYRRALGYLPSEADLPNGK